MIELRSPFARAVVPVLGGIAGLSALALFLWGIAAFVASGNTDNSERLAPSVFTVGPVDSLAEQVEVGGPLLFPELGTSIGTRSIVIDHTGTVAADNWRVYWAYPADREATCVVQQVVGTRTFTDCDGRTIKVTDLAPPDKGVFPRVEDRKTLVIDLRGAEASSGTATVGTATTG